MYIITNRKLNEGETGFNQFGKTVNEKGPNELRAVRVEKAGRKWSVTILDENGSVLTDEERKRMKLKADETAWPSHKAAIDIVDAVTAKNRNLLLFIHGFDNDMEDVAKRCAKLEKLYDVEVLAFSWPADGGGLLAKGSRYDGDKRDARASSGAVEHTLEVVSDHLRRLSNGEQDFKVSLLMHSMGCYLYEQIQRAGDPSGHAYLFDNIILAAADCNNYDHAYWVDKIKAKSRVFITINENDRALRWSEDMRGENSADQLARLGQHISRKDLSSKAFYIDFTEIDEVHDEHSYFTDKKSLKYKHVKNFFHAAFNGERAEPRSKTSFPGKILGA